MTLEEQIEFKAYFVRGFGSHDLEEVYAKLEDFAQDIGGHMGYDRNDMLRNGRPGSGTIAVPVKSIVRAGNYTIEVEWSLDEEEKDGRPYYRI